MITMANQSQVAAGCGIALPAPSSPSLPGGSAAAPTSSTATTSSSTSEMKGDYAECTSLNHFWAGEEPMPDLNEEQMSALKSIILGIHCEQRHIDIILGQSGSGKTRLVASALLALGEGKRAMVWVPNTTHAIELLDAVEELGHISVGRQIGKFLILSQENNMPKKYLLQQIHILAFVYSNAFLFWKHHMKETVKSFDSLKVLYEYHFKKDESLQFLDFFKIKISSAIEDLANTFQFIRRLPKSFVTGIDVAHIRRLLQQLNHVYDDLSNKDIGNDSLCSVFGILLPPEKSINHDDDIAAAREIKEKMTLCIETIQSIKDHMKLKDFATQNEFKDYMLRTSQVIICNLSSYSNLDNILFNKIQHTGRKIDLVIIDDAFNKSSRDFLSKIDLLGGPGIKNIVLTTDTLDQEEAQQGTIMKVLSSMSTKIHELTKRYRIKVKHEALANNSSQASFTPLLWIGISQDLLAPVRDQGNTDTCTLHSSLAATETIYIADAAADDPPRKFPIVLCIKDMEGQYQIFTGMDLGSETSRKEKGKYRVEKAFTILKEKGILGKSKSGEEMVEDFDEIHKLLKEENVFVGSFRLSRNFFNLYPKQAYKYNEKEPIINPTSNLPCSHAVMIVGFIPTESSQNQKLTEYEDKRAEKGLPLKETAKNNKLVYQNSFGRLFGKSDGLGVVQASSIRQFYRPIL